MPKGIYNHKDNHTTLGRHWNVKDTSNMSRGQLGRILSKEHKKKLSEARLKNPTRYWLGKKGINVGKKHGCWKGEEAKYRTKHTWVVYNLGKAKKCEHCGKLKTTPKSIHWANKSRLYLRDLTDWIQLCVSCHKKYDSKAQSNIKKTLE